ncbi:MAG: helix-turn-helix transcriptional regulator [Polyangiales bacterium]
MTSTLIDLAEAAYDLDLPDSEWLPSIIDAGLPLLDRGFGVAGGIYSRPADGTEATLHQLHVAGGPRGFAMRLARIAARVPHSRTGPGLCSTLSEASGEACALALATRAPEERRATDALGLWAFDTFSMAAFIIAPVHQCTRMRGSIRIQWRKVGAHLNAGFRLRHALVSPDERAHAPHVARRVLREAAVRADRSHRHSSNRDRLAALKIWTDLVEGRCTMVDRFESGSRRFVLATCNPPGTKDPHRLTRREAEVATRAASGETGKRIGWELGLSTSRVSGLLRDVMRKLRVSTQAELVEKMRALGPASRRPAPRLSQ